MKRLSSAILFILLLVFIHIWNHVFAEVWWLDGVDIISREEWWADESLRWKYGGSYSWYLQDIENYEKRQQGDFVDESGKYERRSEKNAKNAKRRSFLINKYPDEIATDKIIEFNGKQLLRWPLSYKYDKTKIIIHHTADTYDFLNKEEAMENIRKMYVYHAIKKWRGDIGYNFLIDKFWNIYEWRAGGVGVVGAHADWNNTKTIGIALMGNFEKVKPSPEMRQSLLKLTTALVQKYHINIDQKQTYFTAIDHAPRLEHHEHKSIIWHKDSKNTACPGVHVYEHLNALRKQVYGLQKYFASFRDIPWGKIHFLTASSPFYLQHWQWTISLYVPHGGALYCENLWDAITIKQCSWSHKGENQVLIHLVRKSWNKDTWWNEFLLKVWWEWYIINTLLVREDDIVHVLSERREQYHFSASDTIRDQAWTQKVQKKITLDRVPALLQKNISVLLYHLTADYDTRNMRCESDNDEGCTVQLDDITLQHAKIINIVENKKEGNLWAYVDLKKYDTTSLQITALDDGLIRFTNDERYFENIPMNSFRGSIKITKESYKHLEDGVVTRYVVINTLPVLDYFHGMAEISEKQHIEKLKTMALLIKGYTLFYLEWKNPHPSIPKGVSYQAIDDPRIFQKYLWAWFEQYGKKWQQALEETKNEIVVYEDYLPILPYFHCSAGFTKSWKENFWRSDTPRLRSVLDFAHCDSWWFAWHGVWLSWDGAEALAEKWVKYDEIIKWYYKGVKIKKIK